jgi:flagellar L-ring protein precursor FlgH
VRIIIIIALLVPFLGCSSKSKQPEKKDVTINGEKAVRYSEVSQMPSVANRNYKRMTRSRMEEEAEIHPQAGSMWVMEGQGAYLFTQNKSRREGDLLNVKIEGPAQKQIETKVTVIKKLLQQLEDDEKKAKELEAQKLAEKNKPEENSKDAVAVRAPASVKPEEKKEIPKEEPINIESVPTRITERMPDGNYRIKGQQPFMIGKREYKVIVTGVIRSEDFNDEGLSSNKLLDPQFDVVSLRKKEM